MSELIQGIRLALRLPASACPAFLRNGKSEVEIDALVAAVNNARRGCSITPSPTPTMESPVPSQPPTLSPSPSPTYSASPTRTASRLAQPSPTRTQVSPTPTQPSPSATQASPTPTATPPPPTPTQPQLTPTRTSAYPRPVVADFNPKSGPAGTLVTISGNNFVPTAGVARAVRMPKQGGGVIDVPIGNASNTKLEVTIPAGADSGALAVSIDEQVVSTASPFTITRPSFQISVSPQAARVMRGFGTAATVSLAGSNGFSQLARLHVEGLPANVSATLKPSHLGPGQTGIIELTAGANAGAGSSMLRVIAEEMVDGRMVRQEGQLLLDVQNVTTSFVGRVVENDATQSPIQGVRVRFLGRRPANVANRTPTPGATTNCSRETVTDSAGNFAFVGLPVECQGLQLVRYEGGARYASVDKQADIQASAVEELFDLVHLPRLADGEEVLIEQNAAVDQTFEFKTIPGLKIIVYAGTTIRLEDGSLPPGGKFPLRALRVPVDRVPGGIDLEGTNDQFVPFLSAFQPANSSASQPIAVFYPNVYGSAPGSRIGLSTLDPTTGEMRYYGSGRVSADGTQIVPDIVSGNRRYGLTNLGWHGVVAVIRNAIDSAIDTLCAKAGKPVDLASGLESFSVVDMALSSARGSIAVTRTYRSLSQSQGPFGRGGSHSYAYRLNAVRPRSVESLNLILPDGNQVPFARATDGSFRNDTIPLFRGAVLSAASDDSSELRMKDGSRWQFIPAAGLGSILSALVDANGNRVELVRNPNRLQQITEIVDPVGRRLSLTYDGGDRITSITDPIGRRVRYTYNGDGALVSIFDAADGETRYEYVAGRPDLLARMYDARKGPLPIVINEYDATGRVVKQTLADGSTRRFQYVLFNPQAPTSPVRLTRYTDGNDNVTTYRFNPQGFLTDVTDALGQTRVFEREPGSNLLTAIRGSAACNICGAAAAGDQEFDYDASGNVVEVRDATGAATRFSYHPTFNKVTEVVDALEHATRFAYDGAGNLVTVTDARQHATHFEYDIFGQLVAIIDPLEKRTTIEYDEYGNPIAVEDALRNRSQARYDGVSRPVELVNALGNATKTEFDALDRVRRVIDALGHATEFEYDAVGNLTVVRDARQNATRFRYDSLGRVDQRTDSLDKSDSRKYDGNGNLVEFTDRRGLKSTYTYDALDRLIREEYADSTVDRVYDANGRLVRADDSMGGTFTYSYDATGRQLSAEGPYGTITYERDALGRVKKRQVVGQPQVDYVYDEVGNLKSATMPTTRTTPLVSVSMTYTNRNELERLERSNNVHTTYDYDDVGQVLSIVHANGNNVLNEHRYTYDPTGNRTSHFNNLAQPLITQAARSVIDSDSDRVLHRGDVTYEYDANNNRTRETLDHGGSTVKYEWDSRGRLQEVRYSDTDTLRLRYDLGRTMIGTVVSGGGSPSRSQQVVSDDYDNVALFREGHSVRQVLSGRAVDHHYGVLSEREGRFGLSDALGSVVATTNAMGQAESVIAYEPYGEAFNVSGTDYDFGFTGRTRLTNSLYYFRARLLDPKSGVFISEDPIGFDGGDTNLARYVLNSPTNRTDPSGEFAGLLIPFLYIIFATSHPELEVAKDLGKVIRAREAQRSQIRAAERAGQSIRLIFPRIETTSSVVPRPPPTSTGLVRAGVPGVVVVASLGTGFLAGYTVTSGLDALAANTFGRNRTDEFLIGEISLSELLRGSRLDVCQ